MLGPTGVLAITDMRTPPNAAKVPIIADVSAIASGVFVRLRAVAAGMINSAVINSAPTTLSATATTAAKSNVKTNCSRRGFAPAACARSGASVAVSKADQCHQSTPKTTAEPIQINARSILVTNRTLPNK